MSARPVLKSRVRRLLPVAAFALAVAGAVARNGLEPRSANAGSLTSLAGAPLYFEPAGPDQTATRFVARGRECNVWLSANEATLTLGRRHSSANQPFDFAGRTEWGGPPSFETRTLRFILEGANAGARMTGLEPLPGKANYLIGNEPSEWRVGLSLFSRVQADEIYPGVRLVYYADEAARLEYDFLLAPGARPDAISLRIAGADEMQVDPAGDLVLKVGDAEVRQHRPVIYQMAGKVRKPVAGGYRLTGRDTAGFWLGDYDRALPLVIDPTLSFATYLGGTKSETGWAIATDPAGNIYVAGETLSGGLAPRGELTANFQGTNYHGGRGPFGDAFVAKYDAVSNKLVYLTYLGGRDDDGALALAVDTAGNAYVTGFTDSRTFPIVPTNGAIRSVITGSANNAFRLPAVDAFVSELNASGSALVFSTLLGGSRRDAGMGIAVDATGVYVTGYTESTNFFPLTNAFQTVAGGRGDAFVTKLDPTGTAVLYSSYLGGTNLDNGYSIDVDNSGNAYITGYTTSTNFPTTNAIVLNGWTYDHLNTQTNSSTFLDAFISKVSSDGSTLLYSTYLGGSNHDAGLRIAVDRPSGNAYVTGYTFSRNFPTNVVPAPASDGTNFTSHAFVTAVDTSDNVIYSAQFGGFASDQGTGIALDSAGNAYITGFTSSTNFFARASAFPTNAFINFRAATTNSAGKAIKPSSPDDSFVAVLDPAGTNFLYAIYLGGAGSDQANDIAVDPAGGAAYVVGQTLSPNFPTTNLFQPSLVQSNLGGVKKSKATDAFIDKILFP